MCEKSAIEVNGRRLVNISAFLKKIKEFSRHNQKYGCSIDNMQIINEKRIGMLSKFTVKCNFCNEKAVISTDDDSQESLDINMSAVSGAMAIGIGFSQMEEFLAAVDVPVMFAKLYSKNHTEVCNKCMETSVEAMTAAAAEERDQALAEGRVSKNGTAMIDVIVDGCWGRRSYRTNYSSLSGAATIIGKKINKVLFMAVRNKYC